MYENLIIYNSHLINPFNQNINFNNEFIKYIILNKELAIFENGLFYIKDIENFINVINENKEEIFIKYLKSHKNNAKIDKNFNLK